MPRRRVKAASSKSYAHHYYYYYAAGGAVAAAVVAGGLFIAATPRPQAQKIQEAPAASTSVRRAESIDSRRSGSSIYSYMSDQPEAPPHIERLASSHGAEEEASALESPIDAVKADAQVAASPTEKAVPAEEAGSQAAAMLQGIPLQVATLAIAGDAIQAKKGGGQRQKETRPHIRDSRSNKSITRLSIGKLTEQWKVLLDNACRKSKAHTKENETRWKTYLEENQKLYDLPKAEMEKRNITADDDAFKFLETFASNRYERIIKKLQNAGH
jgi:hypothetical protein